MIFSFDVGGTIVDDAKGINDFWFKILPEEIARKRGISFEEALEFCKKEYVSHEEKFGKDKDWYSPEFWIRRFGINKSFIDLISKVKYEIRIFDDVKDALDLIRGYRKIIVTNHPIELVKFELGNYVKEFDRIYSSHENETLKSDVALWKKIIKDLKVSSGEIVHVGDRYLHDYLAPTSIGIRAYLLKRKYTNLVELIKIALSF